MIPAIEFRIHTDNSTLRGNIGIYAPAREDSRVFNKEYKLRVFSAVDTGDGLVGMITGSIKCHNEEDVQIVCNNLITLVKSNEDKISSGSFIAIHYCNQVEEDKPIEPCTMTKLWSK